MQTEPQRHRRLFEDDSGRLLVGGSVLEDSLEAFALTDAAGRIVDANDECSRQSGYAPEELSGRTLEVLFDRVTHPDGVAGMLAAAEGDEDGWQGEVLGRSREGDAIAGWAKVTAIRSPAGEVTHFLVFWSDVSELKAREAEISARARNDALTGLPDRAVLEDRLDHALLRMRRSGQRIGVLFVDLDRFKQINDRHGHAGGDSVIKGVASRLVNSLRAADTVGRLGGDEFVVLLESVADAEAAQAVAAQLVEAISEPLMVGSGETRLSASIGIALAPDHAVHARTLLAAADSAMYAAKRAGGDCARLYDHDLEQATRESDRLRAALSRAVIDRDFELHYQPQVRLADGTIVGAEALVRWNHPELGRLPAARFISLAEDSGLILELGNWVIRKACRQVAEWDRMGLRLDLIAVNLSTRQAMLGRLDAELRSILEESGLDPDRLQLEITEGFVMDYASRDARAIGRIRSLGVNLAIDNFGTGYSSLDQLRSLSVRDMKIDRYFVAALGKGDLAGTSAVPQAMLAVARALGLTAVAEGIETEAELQAVRALGCEEGQGRYFSPPLRAEAFAELIARGVPLPPSKSVPGEPAADRP